MAEKKKATTVGKSRPRSTAGRSVQAPGNASINNTVWIFHKEGDDERKPYRVHPSPKAVRQWDFLFFRNLTNLTATVNAPGVLTPDNFPVPPGGAPVPAQATGELTNHAYQVTVNGQRAHGASDPDIIIDR